MSKLIKYSFYFLFFLTPLIITPWNYELFEFNKMVLVYFLTIIIVSAWFIKMVVAKKFIFQRTFWDIPLIIFLLSQILSTIFSIDRHTSFWGYYSRFNGGLLSTISYLLLYWAFVSNTLVDAGRLTGGASREPKVKGPQLVSWWKGTWAGERQDPSKTRSFVSNCIRALLFSATLVASYGILEHFGIDAQYWVQDVRARVFSTIGQPNWLAAWLAALIPLTWALALDQKDPKSSKLKEFLFYILNSTFYICLLYTKSRSGLLGFFAAFIVFWLMVPRATQFLVISSLLLVISSLVGTPWTPSLQELLSKNQSTTNNQPPTLVVAGGTESGEIRKIVWKGALDIWKHYPIFGTGVETFAYSYYWYRPREHNDVSEWDFLYNKAHNEYLNYAATTGSVGLGSYLILIVTFLLWSIAKIFNFQFLISNKFPMTKCLNIKKLKIKNSKIRNLRVAFLSGFVSILVSNFFGFSVAPISLLFFLFPAMSITLGRNTPSRWKQGYTLGFWQLILIATILISTFYILHSTLKYWYADTRFALGEKFIKTNQPKEAFEQLQTAISLRPQEPVYRDSLSFIAANLAVAAYQQKETTLSAQLANLAISESNQALKTSPYHLNFWKNRTKVFLELAPINQKYNQEALQSLLAAAELAPTDPKVKYNLGLLYARLGQTETAIKTLKQTIELKPNYDHARYALALFYEKKGRIKEAREQLEYILEKITPNYEPAKEKLKELNEKSVAPAKTKG